MSSTTSIRRVLARRISHHSPWELHSLRDSLRSSLLPSTGICLPPLSLATATRSISQPKRQTSQSKPRVHDVGELEHHLQICLQHSIQIPHCNKHHRREVETLMCDSAIPSSDESSLWMERRNQQGCMRPRNGGRRGPGRPGPRRPVCCRFWGEHPIGCGDLAKLYETKLTATFASA